MFSLYMSQFCWCVYMCMHLGKGAKACVEKMPLSPGAEPKQLQPGMLGIESVVEFGLVLCWITSLGGGRWCLTKILYSPLHFQEVQFNPSLSLDISYQIMSFPPFSGQYLSAFFSLGGLDISFLFIIPDFTFQKPFVVASPIQGERSGCAGEHRGVGTLWVLHAPCMDRDSGGRG